MMRGKGRVVPRSSAAAATVGHGAQKLPLLQDAAQMSPQSASTAALSVQPQARPASSEWRCAAFLVANSTPVQQLAASKLNSSAGRQLLTSEQPVLLKAWQLAHGKLRQQQSAAAGHSSSSTGCEDAATKQQQQPQQQEDLPQQQQPQPIALQVMCSPCSSNCFIAADATKNMPGSYYHIRKPETSTLSMTFDVWLGCWQQWSSSRLLLQAHVCNWELSGAPLSLRVLPNKAVYPHLTQLLQVMPGPAAAPLGPSSSTSSNTSSSTTAGNNAAESSTSPGSTPQAAVQHLLDWPLLQQLLQTGSWALSGSLHLLAGGQDAVLPARYETHDRLLCQVAGRQRLLLLPPSQAFQGLYPYPVHHAYDRYSAVDWEAPELEHWPAAAQVHGLLADLAPGDTLLVPAYWSVHAQLMQPACVSLELHLQALPTRLRSPTSLLLQLSRMVEFWFGAEAGPANVRRWLQALSAGREWQLLEPQLLTVKGTKLLQCCHMALEQLQQVLALQQTTGTTSNPQHAESAAACVVVRLGSDSNSSSSHGSAGAGPARPAGNLEAAARHFLGCMCDGRLVPTTWLNEGISDPLYLQHPPTYHLIAEDAEAARYSSLFRHRLIANRPDWRQHATPLQLAPPGSKRSLLKAPQAVKAPPCEGTEQTAAVVEG